MDIPLNNDRNSLQCEARIFAVVAQEGDTQKKDAEGEGTARVLALQGYLSKYVQEMEMTPG